MDSCYPSDYREDISEDTEQRYPSIDKEEKICIINYVENQDLFCGLEENAPSLFDFKALAEIIDPIAREAKLACERKQASEFRGVLLSGATFAVVLLIILISVISYKKKRAMSGSQQTEGDIPLSPITH